MPREGDTVTWVTASLRAAVIVLYFIVATVWLPDFVLDNFLDEASALVVDLVAPAIWAGALIVGMWALRVGQRRGLI